MLQYEAMNSILVFVVVVVCKWTNFAWILAHKRQENQNCTTELLQQLSLHKFTQYKIRHILFFFFINFFSIYIIIVK